MEWRRTWRVTLKVVRYALIAVLSLGAGYWTAVMLFSDAMVDELEYALWFFGTHLLAGFLIGLLARRRWYLVVFAMWGALWMGLLLWNVPSVVFHAFYGAPLTLLAGAMAGGHLPLRRPSALARSWSRLRRAPRAEPQASE
jgi:hypothetical protein